jgi:hypothetical protein
MASASAAVSAPTSGARESTPLAVPMSPAGGTVACGAPASELACSRGARTAVTPPVTRAEPRSPVPRRAWPAADRSEAACAAATPARLSAERTRAVRPGDPANVVAASAAPVAASAALEAPDAVGTACAGVAGVSTGVSETAGVWGRDASPVSPEGAAGEPALRGALDPAAGGVEASAGSGAGAGAAGGGVLAAGAGREGRSESGST